MDCRSYCICSKRIRGESIEIYYKETVTWGPGDRQLVKSKKVTVGNRQIPLYLSPVKVILSTLLRDMPVIKSLVCGAMAHILDCDAREWDQVPPTPSDS